MSIAVVIIAVLLLQFLWPRDRWQINVSRAAVIKEMRSLNRLETASFTIEKIIDAQTTGNVFQQVLFGDKILLIAHGEVIAGIDLAQLKDEDMQVDGTRIKINLPAPQVIVTRLDSTQTRVYDRQQGLLARGQKDFESEVRQAAEESIRQAACDGDILEQARENGRKQLTALLSAFGFTEITLNIPEGKCAVE